MARWDDLHRAIIARDPEGAESVWMELLETDLEAVDRFLDAARTLAKQPGGRRQSGILLSMLAQALKEKELTRELISIYVELAGLAPDDGSVRNGLIEATRATYPGRPDLDALLEKSGVVGGAQAELGRQAQTLASYLLLEPGTYVFHKSGWGVGRIVDYIPERERCVIDFKDKPGHEMDIDAAASRLERLLADDIRAMALSDPKRLRKWASEEPLVMVEQVLQRHGGSTSLRHIKDALVPDAVATSRWSTWWKEARKAVHLDPRFHVGGGRDPRLEFHGSAQVDFNTQVLRTFRGCATVEERQKAAREFLATAATDEEAQATLAEIVRDQLKMVTRPATQLGWDLLLADLEGRDRSDVYRDAVSGSSDPTKLLITISDDETRGAAARSMIVSREEDGPEIVYKAALDQDDPVIAEAGVDRYPSIGRPELVWQLLDAVNGRPALHPSLWAWYVRGLRRERWEGRTYEPYPLMQRVLKVLDAVEYRGRRTPSAKDKRGVAALADALTSRNGLLVQQAAEACDAQAARHLIQMIEQNRGIKGRAQQKVQTIILRKVPDALRSEEEVIADGEVAIGKRLDRIYMTPDGIELVKSQVRQIENEDMPDNAKEIARAREFGDLSENAEYHAAREKQGLLQAKLDQLKSDLARAVPITSDLVRTDAVSVGTKVHLKDPEGHEYVYTLLGPPDTDVQQGVISYLTPLGQALMGRKPGDRIQVTVEDESRDLEVLGIDIGFAG